MSRSEIQTALIMSGGGASAAYQVGVLRAIARMLPHRSRNPFQIICGTSACAINAAILASNVDRFDRAVSRLAPMDEIAIAHADELPRAMRRLMRRIGVLAPNGARVLSYLLFERGYCRHLMNMGFSDGMAQRARILDFLGHDATCGERPSLAMADADRQSLAQLHI
jgi:predicted acylesterase/phospholipase RssA